MQLIAGSNIIDHSNLYARSEVVSYSCWIQRRTPDFHVSHVIVNDDRGEIPLTRGHYRKSCMVYFTQTAIRMRPRRTLKALLLACAGITVVWMLMAIGSTDDANTMEENILQRAKQPQVKDLHLDSGDPESHVPESRLAVKGDISDEKNQNELHPRNFSTNIGSKKELNSNVRLSQHTILKQSILTINNAQKIYNRDRFPRRPEDSIVILVMVHDRLEYLEYLIESLRKADGISNALLIFSHDYYVEDINRLVRKVDFCQMMQIFYPYSLQVYQNEFPGPDPKDCPRDITQDKAKELKCNNWEHPDSYGHYREVRYVMTKHHWFWKLQHVFSGLEATRNHQGLVLLLEEDHYLAPDFYPMLQKMYQLKKQHCPECDILTLGNYDKHFVYKDRNDKVDTLSWQSSKHNMGMSMDRKTWDKLQPCVPQFCSYDDYNWDWTMNFISHKCLASPLQVMVFKSPRVFHIGECGIHHKGKGKCSADELVKRIDETLAANKDSLFPKNLVLTPKTRPLKTRLPKPNGGWGDIRDHTLCMTYGKPTKKL